MITVVYLDAQDNVITADNVRSITLTPHHDRSLPESITLNAGIGGDGQLSRGTIVPIENVQSITVDVAGAESE